MRTTYSIVDDETNIERAMVVEEIDGQAPRVVELVLRPLNGATLVPVDHAKLLDVFTGKGVNLAIAAAELPAPKRPGRRPATIETEPVDQEVTPVRQGRARWPAPQRDSQGRYRMPPLDVMKRLFAAHGGTPRAMAEAFGVPQKTMGNWIYLLRRKGQLLPSAFRAPGGSSD